MPNQQSMNNKEEHQTPLPELTQPGTGKTGTAERKPICDQRHVTLTDTVVTDGQQFPPGLFPTLRGSVVDLNELKQPSNGSFL